MTVGTAYRNSLRFKPTVNTPIGGKPKMSYHARKAKTTPAATTSAPRRSARVKRDPRAIDATHRGRGRDPHRVDQRTLAQEREQYHGSGTHAALDQKRARDAATPTRVAANAWPGVTAA